MLLLSAPPNDIVVAMKREAFDISMKRDVLDMSTKREVVLLHTCTISIAHSQAELSGCVPLLGCIGVPLYCLCHILLHTCTVFVAHSQVALRLCMPLLSPCSAALVYHSTAFASFLVTPSPFHGQ